jgi:hypothetical protein
MGLATRHTHKHLGSALGLAQGWWVLTFSWLVIWRAILNKQTKNNKCWSISSPPNLWVLYVNILKKPIPIAGKVLFIFPIKFLYVPPNTVGILKFRWFLSTGRRFFLGKEMMANTQCSTWVSFSRYVMT